MQIETTKIAKPAFSSNPAELPIENYSPQRKAEFLLSNVIDDIDYEEARKSVREMGLDPDKIPHYNPSK